MAEMTRRAFSGLAAVNVMCPLLAPRTVQAQAANQLSLDRYELKFDSDFEPLGRVADKTPGTGDTVNGSQWTPRYRFTNDPRGCSFHGEYQWYVDPRFDWGPGIGHISPFSVSSRELAITARRTPAGLAAKMAGRLDQEKRETNVPHPWISGVITTQNSFWFRYGYAEAMVKLPRGRTLWPAFWMLPKEWPYPPEVDIMEFIGDEPRKSNYNVIAGTPDKPMDGRGDYSVGQR